MATADRSVLYLSYDGLTDPLGQSQILPYLCGLSVHYTITILSFEKPARFQLEQAAVQEICHRHNLDWIPQRYHKRPPVLSTLYDLWKLKRNAKRLHRQHHFKIIHCRSYIPALVGLWMKHTYQVKFLFDMRGFWADERVDGGLWNLKNPVYQSIFSFFKNKEKAFIQEADTVIVLTENAKREILSWNLNNKIRVIPTCVDLDHFNPSGITHNQKELLLHELRIKPGEFILLYLGSPGTWYLIDEMLDFFGQLKKARPDAKFLVITPEPGSWKYQHLMEDVIVRKASRKNVPLFISLANASIVFIKPAFSKKASSATKIAEALAMEVPVLSNTGWGDVSEYQHTLPGFVTISGPDDYPDAIRALTQTRSPGEIRKGASASFSLAGGTAKYAGIYHELI